MTTVLGAFGCTDGGRAKSIAGNMTKEPPLAAALVAAAVIIWAAT